MLESSGPLEVEPERGRSRTQRLRPTYSSFSTVCQISGYLQIYPSYRVNKNSPRYKNRVVFISMVDERIQLAEELWKYFPFKMVAVSGGYI